MKNHFKTLTVLSLILILSYALYGCGIRSGTDGPDGPENTDAPEKAYYGDPEVEGLFNIYCFSFGKADSFLIYTDESAVLIDTGRDKNGNTICDFAKKICGGNIDVMIVTHFDEDHVGGAPKVIKKCNVEKIYQSNYPKDSEEYDDYIRYIEHYGPEDNTETVTRITSFELDGAEYTIYPPSRIYSDDPSNNSSLIVSVKYGEKYFLFTGDAEKDRIKDFEVPEGITYDFLKMPYHGNWFKALTAFAEDVMPKTAVITSSEEDPENDTTVSLLTRLGCKIFLTRTAPVCVRSDGSEIYVFYDVQN